MKKHLITYLLGFASAVLAIAIINYVNRGPSRSYNYESKEHREKLISILESRDILYSHEIDHLKRHWITPWVFDEKYLEPVEREIKEWEESKN